MEATKAILRRTLSVRCLGSIMLTKGVDKCHIPVQPVDTKNNQKGDPNHNLSPLATLPSVTQGLFRPRHNLLMIQMP